MLALLSLVPLLSIVSPAASTSRTADDDAQASSATARDGFTSGPYLTLSAGGNLSLAQGNSHRLGVGGRTAGGHLWRLPHHVNVYFGGGLDYRRFYLGEAGGPNRSSRIFAMTRVGSGTDRLWGYGLAAVGMSNRGASPQTPGGLGYVRYLIGLEVGGGAAVKVWRSIFIGGELTLDLKSDAFDEDSSYDDELAFLNLRLVTGWNF